MDNGLMRKIPLQFFLLLLRLKLSKQSSTNMDKMAFATDPLQRAKNAKSIYVGFVYNNNNDKVFTDWNSMATVDFIACIIYKSVHCVYIVLVAKSFVVILYRTHRNTLLGLFSSIMQKYSHLAWRKSNHPWSIGLCIYIDIHIQARGACTRHGLFALYFFLLWNLLIICAKCFLFLFDVYQSIFFDSDRQNTG